MTDILDERFLTQQERDELENLGVFLQVERSQLTRNEYQAELTDQKTRQYLKHG